MDGSNGGTRRMYKIFAIVERPGSDKDFWRELGMGFVNRDESITCKLDCIPLSGTIQLREHDPKATQNRRNSGAGRRFENNTPQDQWYEGGKK